MDAIYVGIDVSKDRLDVHVRPSGEAFAVTRDGKGLEELVERLHALAPTLIAVEATGGFETIVAAAVAGARCLLAVVNPAQMRHFARAISKRAKTDPIDAAVIAHFAEAVKPEPRPIPDAQARLLGELVARRRQIIEMLVAERQREQRVDAVRVRKSLARHIAALEKALPGSTAISTRWSAARRSGAKGRPPGLRSRESAASLPAPFWPRCPNLAVSTAARSQASPGLPPSPASPVAGAAKA